jgi:hypothetical protein
MQRISEHKLDGIKGRKVWDVMKMDKRITEKQIEGFLTEFQAKIIDMDRLLSLPNSIETPEYEYTSYGADVALLIASGESQKNKIARNGGEIDQILDYFARKADIFTDLDEALGDEISNKGKKRNNRLAMMGSNLGELLITGRPAGLFDTIGNISGAVLTLLDSMELLGQHSQRKEYREIKRIMQEKMDVLMKKRHDINELIERRLPRLYIDEKKRLKDRYNIGFWQFWYW